MGRRTTAEERAAAVAGWKASGKTKSAYARQEGIGQATFWRWAQAEVGREHRETKENVSFVRVGSLPSAFLVGAETREDDGALQSDLTIEGGELRVVARRGTRWSDVQKLVELMRGGR